MRLFLVIFFLTASSLIACGQTSRFHQDMTAELDSGKYSIALEKLNRHLYENPYDYYAYKLRGVAGKGLKMHEQALTDYNIYLEYHPDDKEAYFERAVLRYQTERYKQAAEDFRHLLRNQEALQTTTAVYFQHSSNSATGTNIFTVQSGVKSICYYYLGSSYHHQEEPLKAIVYFDSALSLSPNTVDYLIARALAWENAENFDAAISDYRKVLSRAPDHGLAKYNMGNLLNRMGRTAEGAAYLEESIKEQPELAYPHAEKAFRFMENGRYETALTEYNKAIAIDPENAGYLLNRGKVKIKLSDLPGATGDFEKVILLQPENEQAYFNLAIVEHKKGRYRKAVELLDMAIFYYPEYASAYYNRAIAYHSLKNKEKACADIKTAEEMNMEVPENLLLKLCSP